MHTNLISRFIHSTVPVPGGGGGDVIGEKKKNYQKKSQYDFRFIWRPNNSALGHPKVGGDTIPNVAVFLVTSPLRIFDH